jgi:RNA polymerase sigma-70 factor, ECF subfamily
LVRRVDDRYIEAYDRCWLPVYRSALAWSNEASAAEDLAQEAFLRLWERRGSIDWDGPVLGWLLVTVRRLATDRFRRLRSALIVGDRQRRPPGWDEQLWVEWLDVQAAMRRLRPIERTALVLMAVEGLSSGEVGDAIGVSAGAVRAVVNRARSKLEATR